MKGMNEMETLTLKQANKMIINEVMECKLFNRPEVDFILFNDKENSNQTSIGVHEHDTPSLAYIFLLETKAVISVHDIDLNDEDKAVMDLYNNNLEGYFLLRIESEENYINYVSLDFHIRLWNYISSLEGNIFFKYFSIKYYISYCKENGINYKLINTYSNDDLVDIIEDFDFVYNEDNFLDLLDNLNRKILCILSETNKSVINQYLTMREQLMGKNYE